MSSYVLKIGTRVELSRPSGGFKKGLQGVVSSINLSGATWPYGVEFDNGSIGRFMSSELKIVEGAKEPVKATGFEVAVNEVYSESKALLLKKHHDYGPGNIAGSPGGPLNGLTVRLYDKIARLANLMEKGVEPENESVLDTFRDIANYGHIGELVCRGDWPGAEKPTTGGGHG